MSEKVRIVQGDKSAIVDVDSVELLSNINNRIDWLRQQIAAYMMELNSLEAAVPRFSTSQVSVAQIVDLCKPGSTEPKSVS